MIVPEIIPSPGTEDREWQLIENKIEAVKPFVKSIHIDICDGIFAPNKTFAEPEFFKKYITEKHSGKGGLLFEVHLMVVDPIKHIKAWADAGFRRFIGQIEKMPDQEEFVAQAQLLGDVGLGVDGPTPLEAVKVPFDDLDTVLFYTGDRAGFSGKSLQTDRLEKVKVLREKMEFLPIEADGGLNAETVAIAASAGISRFVVTSAIYNTGTPDGQVKLLKERLKDSKVYA